MSDSPETKSIKERLTFAWPTRSPSKASIPTQVIIPFTETKLPVKQRVVFPSDRFSGNHNNNGKSGNNNVNSYYNGNTGTKDNGNTQRFQRDETWDAMADMFRASSSSSSPNPWAVGSDNNSNANNNSGNNNNDGFNNSNNKRRKYDQRDKLNNNNLNNGGQDGQDGESSGCGNNFNRGFNNNPNQNSNRNKFQQKKRPNDGCEFGDDNNRQIRDSGVDSLKINWSETVSETGYHNFSCKNFSSKSIATQTDLVSHTQSIGVQTDDFLFDSSYHAIAGQQQQQQQQLEMQQQNHFNSNHTNKESGFSIVTHYDSNERHLTNNGPIMIPGNTYSPVHRDPRVARRAKNFQPIISG